MTDKSDTSQQDSKSKQRSSILVVNIGKHKRKRIRRLRKGKGKLMRKVQSSLDDMKAENLLAGDAQVVVMVVKEKSKRKFGKSFY